MSSVTPITEDHIDNNNTENDLRETTKVGDSPVKKLGTKWKNIKSCLNHPDDSFTKEFFSHKLLGGKTGFVATLLCRPRRSTAVATASIHYLESHIIEKAISDSTRHLKQPSNAVHKMDTKTWQFKWNDFLLCLFLLKRPLCCTYGSSKIIFMFFQILLVCTWFWYHLSWIGEMCCVNSQFLRSNDHSMYWCPAIETLMRKKNVTQGVPYDEIKALLESGLAATNTYDWAVDPTVKKLNLNPSGNNIIPDGVIHQELILQYLDWKAKTSTWYFSSCNFLGFAFFTFGVAATMITLHEKLDGPKSHNLNQHSVDNGVYPAFIWIDETLEHRHEDQTMVGATYDKGLMRLDIDSNKKSKKNELDPNKKSTKKELAKNTVRRFSVHVDTTTNKFIPLTSCSLIPDKFNHETIKVLRPKKLISEAGLLFGLLFGTMFAILYLTRLALQTSTFYINVLITLCFCWSSFCYVGMFVGGFQIHLANIDRLAILGHHCADNTMPFVKFMNLYRVCTSSLHLWAEGQEKIIFFYFGGAFFLFASNVFVLIAVYPLFMNEAYLDSDSPRASAFQAYQKVYIFSEIFTGLSAIIFAGLLYQIAKVSNGYNDLILFLTEIRIENEEFTNFHEELSLIHEKRGSFTIFDCSIRNDEVIFMGKIIFFQVLLFAIATSWS